MLGRNYFFVTTLFFVILCIALYAANGSNLGGTASGNVSWNATLNFNNIFRSVFVNGFSHNNWMHVLLNMLCFLVVGSYLERKIGSLKLLLLVLALGFFANIAVSANSQTVNWRGFSGTNFALYFYIIFDYIFYLFSKKKTKTDIIYGAIILAAIYVAMCYVGDKSSFAMTWYPYDLAKNIGHYSSALVGIVFCLVVQTLRLYTDRKENGEDADQ